jgi:hypothetical protein
MAVRTRSWWSRVKGVVWWGVILLLAWFVGEVAYAAFITPASGQAPGRGSHGGAVVGAVAVASLVVLLASVERLRLRRRRRKHPERYRAPVHPTYSGGGSTPGNDLFGWIFWTACLAASLAFFISATVQGYASWRQSVEVQEHGLRATGTVIGVRNVAHAKRYGHYNTVWLVVRLTPPVAAADLTTVHTKYSRSPYPVGRSIVILVDPADPAYAELPGHPRSNEGDVVSSSGWRRERAGLRDASAPPADHPGRR